MGYDIATIVSRIKTKKIALNTLIALLAAAALGVVFMLMGRVQAAVGGPACNVPADYATIQLAVNDVGCSTVKVAAGTYTENVTISRSLTLKGAKSGDNVNWRTFAGPNESTVTGQITIQATDVTINGFSLTNPNQGLGVVVKTAGNDAVVKNNIVDGIGGAAFVGNTVGIYLELGPDNVKIIGNKISHIQSGSTAGSAQGILIGDSTSANPSLGIRVTDNLISDLTSGARGAYGVQVNNGASTVPTATGYATVKIRDNTIKNLTGNWAHAIGLEGDTPNVVVTGNTISNLLDTNPSPIADTIAVFFESNVFFFTGDVSRNSLAVSPSAYGIAVHPALTALYPTLNVDGTCNWWGASNGPGPVGTGSGSKVSTNVDYKPWLKSRHLDWRCGSKDHHNHHDDDNRHWDHDDDWDWDHDKHHDD